MDCKNHFPLLRAIPHFSKCRGRGMWTWKPKTINPVWCLCFCVCLKGLWTGHQSVLSYCTLCIFSPATLFQVCPSLLSIPSALSKAVLLCSSRSNDLFSLFSSLFSIFWSYNSQSGSLCFIIGVLLFRMYTYFVLCLWWKRNCCCVLEGVTLGQRINVMFRSKRIVHHPVPLPGCRSSFSSLFSVAYPCGWVLCLIK